MSLVCFVVEKSGDGSNHEAHKGHERRMGFLSPLPGLVHLLPLTHSSHTLAVGYHLSVLRT